MTKLQILKTLKNAGFPMDAIVEATKNQVTIGYIADGVVQLADATRTEQAVEIAGEILGWGGYCCAWGGWVLDANYKIDPLAGTMAGREHY